LQVEWASEKAPEVTLMALEVTERAPSDAVTVREPALFKVMVKFRDPFTRFAAEGKAA
jgi:hypothetical protein